MKGFQKSLLIGFFKNDIFFGEKKMQKNIPPKINKKRIFKKKNCQKSFLIGALYIKMFRVALKFLRIF